MSSQVRQRCAIYTRKSSDEGLDQAFNSLDAQREAGEAYVKSQASEGWKLIPTRYDDGGFSGGTIERPALQRLLADVDAGRIDVVVVYKIDRLTRSLADFARIVERFDARGVSFVSVTQSFNTTSSMGRLTLNVLLSFAQFEREVTGERIRDKIAASKAKGMWMGGTLPLGYDRPASDSRTLVVNNTEAELVRSVFSRYLELGSVHRLCEDLHHRGIRSKQWVTTSGRELGGKPFSRGALFHLLRNRLYLGEIRHSRRVSHAGGMTTQETTWHPGAHEGIVPAELFDAVGALLDQQTRRASPTKPALAIHDLTGRLFDARGNPMSPTHARGRSGKLYRYYVSASLQRGQRPDQTDAQPQRVSAAALERALTDGLARLLPNEHRVLNLPRRIEVHLDRLILTLPRQLLASCQARLGPGEAIVRDPKRRETSLLILPISLASRSGRIIVAVRADRSRRRDPVLIGALRRAHAMLDKDASGPQLSAAPLTQYGRRLVGLACLAPDIQADILEGRQPIGLSLDTLIARELPLDWNEQRRVLGWAGKALNLSN